MIDGDTKIRFKTLQLHSSLKPINRSQVFYIASVCNQRERYQEQATKPNHKFNVLINWARPRQRSDTPAASLARPTPDSGKIPNQIRQITKTTNYNYRPKYLWIFETPIHCSANHLHSLNPKKSRPNFVNSSSKAKTSLVRLRFRGIGKWGTC